MEDIEINLSFSPSINMRRKSFADRGFDQVSSFIGRKKFLITISIKLYLYKEKYDLMYNNNHTTDHRVLSYPSKLPFHGWERSL